MKKIIALMLAVVMLLGNVPVALAQSGGGNAWQTPIPSALNVDQEYIQANSEKLFSGENVIEDPVIREAINAAYRREGDKVNLPVTAEMLKHVVTLSPEKCLPHNPGEDAHKCKSLKGMEYATNLEYVSLPYQPIEDMSPLKDLTKLKYLNITGNDKVKDFSFFNNLVNLEEIHIRMVKVKDISAFANYKNLRYLDADSCEISDFSPLSELTKLTFLNLDKNIFAENSSEAFAKLVNLEFLNINNKAPNYGMGFFPKKINDIAPLAGLTKLKEFHATGHAIEDISILKNMPNLTTVFLNNNNIADFSPVDHVKNVNGKTDQVILTESDKFKPVLKTVDVPVGTTVTAEMLKACIENLPADATLSLVNGMVVADTSKEGTTKQQAKITFKDDSHKFVMLTINVVPEQQEKPHESLQVMLMKNDVPLQENVTFEILDGDNVVEEVALTNGMGEVTKYEVGNTYTVRVTSPDKYEAETTFMKVVEEEGMAGAHFLKSEDEATSFDNAAFLRVKEKATEPAKPQDSLTVYIAKDNDVFKPHLEVEVLDNGRVIDTIVFERGSGRIKNYELDKIYSLRIKNNDSLELVTPFAKTVKDSERVIFFLETNDYTIPGGKFALEVKDKGTEPSTPQEPERLDQLTIKVKVYDEPKAGIRLRINYFDELGIPGIVNQPETDASGSYVLKDLKPNSKYTVVIPSSEYNFDENTFDVLTDKDGKIVSVAGHPASEYKDGMIIKGVDKSDTSLDNVDVELKVVDKATGKPQKDVEVTANKIFPLQSFRNVKSDENGVVRFKLTGNEEGMVYSMTVSKNGQFLWEFEPEVVNVKVYKDHFEVLKTEKNPNGDDTLRVTFNDRSHLRGDLKALVEKAKGMLDSGKYTDASVKDLKTAVQGGVAELAKAETIPYYVQGHIDNIKKAMEKLVLKEESKPNPSKPDPKPNPNPSTPKPKDEGRYYFFPYVPAATEKKEDKKASTAAKNKLYVPYRNLPVTLTDIPANEKGDAIRAMVTRGILVGMGNDKFEPETTISRAMVTAVFMRISMDQTIKSPASFTDVKDKAWYERSVKWASTNGLIKGYEDGSFKPNKKVSYEEFAVMLDNLLKEYKLDLPKVKTVNKADFDYVSDWSRDSVVRMIELGLMKTDANGKVQPKGEYSRADLAETLNQLIQWSDKNK